MNIQRWQRKFNAVSFYGVLLPIAMNTAIAPVSANPTIVVGGGGISIGINQSPIGDRGFYHGGYQSPPASSFIYGSPIPTPMPVNPATGLMPSRTDYYSQPSGYYSQPSGYYSYPRRQNVINSTLVNPILVNPTIRDSTLINPVIVNDPRYQRPFRRSRITIYGN